MSGYRFTPLDIQSKPCNILPENRLKIGRKSAETQLKSAENLLKSAENRLKFVSGWAIHYLL